MRTLNYFLADSAKHIAVVHQLDFIESFLQVNVIHRFFVKLDGRYGEYFPDYSKYFGRPLRLKKSMHGMTNYGKLFSGELVNWLKDKAGFDR